MSDNPTHAIDALPRAPAMRAELVAEHNAVIGGLEQRLRYLAAAIS